MTTELELARAWLKARNDLEGARTRNMARYIAAGNDSGRREYEREDPLPEQAAYLAFRDYIPSSTGEVETLRQIASGFEKISFSVTHGCYLEALRGEIDAVDSSVKEWREKFCRHQDVDREEELPDSTATPEQEDR